MKPYLILFSTLLVACSTSDAPFSDKSNIHKFQSNKEIQLDEYWYQGEAQILTYNLTQNRYRGENPGEAILIQVTEDFNTNAQVKSDASKKDDNSHIKTVLKTNLIERFTTGMYDYSMMTSVFTGVDFPCPTYKVTHSSQDWCGQSMVQINKQANQFQHRLFSYFESEGDQVNHLPEVWLEDELFNLIRMAPDQIKVGKVHMLPSTKTMRLLHLPAKAVKTDLQIKIKQDTSTLTIKMPEINRTKTISFLSKPPHTITAWTDAYPSVFDQKVRTTKANLKSEVKAPYWELNQTQNIEFRERLGLRLY